MTKKMLLILCLCFMQEFYAQSDFRKGYIITRSGETQVGFINYREGSRNSEVCEFKATEDQKTTTYSPHELAGYGFDNDARFTSKTIVNKSNEPQVLFIEVLVEGTATLFKHGLQFFIEKGADFKALSNDNSEEIIGTEIVTTNPNRHVGTLLYLLGDCQNLKKRIEKIKLAEKPLTLLIEKYNTCIGGNTVSYKEDKRWIATDFGVYAGYNSTSYSFNKKGALFFTDDLGNNSSVMLGVFTDLYAPRVNERMALHIGLSYHSANYTAAASEQSILINYERDVVADFKQVKIPIGLRFFFTEGSITPYFNLGFSNTINLSSSIVWTEKQNYNDFSSTKSVETETSNYKFGLWAGFGLKKKLTHKMDGFIELRYDYSRGKPENDEFASQYVWGDTSPRILYEDKTSSLQVIVGIRL